MRGISHIAELILVVLIIIALSVLVYQWSVASSAQTQESLKKNLPSEGCLKIENIDTLNKKITIRNCGNTNLSNFVAYLDSRPIANYSGQLNAGDITQLGFTVNVAARQNHDIQVTADYAESSKMTVYKNCDVYIYQYMIPYDIDKSNTYYCLAENVFIDNKTAIDFAGVQNSTLDCQGYNLNGTISYTSYPRGIFFVGGKYNSAVNCNITNFWYGMDVDASDNNMIINNILTSNNIGIHVSVSSDYNTLINNTVTLNGGGITIMDSDNNILLNNNVFLNGEGFYLARAHRTNISGGSVYSNTLYDDYTVDDYYATDYQLVSYVRNTNFTSLRKIYFYSKTSWFNYNNDTTGELWLRTNVSVAATIMSRKLINWNNTLLQWNDSASKTVTVDYNITGLKPNKWYLVYNNSKITYALKTDSTSSLDFTIYLPLNEQHEIKVWAIPDYCDIPIISFSSTYIIDQNNTYYCLVDNVNINGQNAINFTSGIQNSTLDGQGYNIDGNDASNTYGVYLNGTNTKNNTITNCNITDFYNGIYLYSGPKNNIITNNTANSNVNGINISNFYSISNYNNITNNIANNNTYGISFYWSSNNTLTNNIANNNSICGIYIISNSHSSTLINNTANNNSDGIELSDSNNSILINNTIYNNTNRGIVLCTGSNNTITGGSIMSSGSYDYFLNNASTTNNFTNTNFTAARTINFYEPTSWFIYANDTSGLWLMTNASTASTLRRKLIRWGNTLIQWNDTSDTSITARYNITGLIASTSYKVYNNSVAIPGSPFNSGLNGQINFTINLPANYQCNITVST